MNPNGDFAIFFFAMRMTLLQSLLHFMLLLFLLDKKHCKRREGEGVRIQWKTDATTRSVLKSGDNFVALWITDMDECKGGAKSMTGLEQLAET